MKIGDFLKTTKGKVVTLASGTGVIAVGIAIAVLMQGSGWAESGPLSCGRPVGR